MGGMVSAEKIASLPDLMNPYYIAVDDQHLYALDKAEVFIYSLKDFSLKKKFGKRGEGPREFMISPGGEGMMIFPTSDSLVINSTGKVSFFSKNGTFIKEMKTPSAFRGNPMIQIVGKNLVGIGAAIDRKSQSISIVTALFDGELNKIKELKKQPFMKGARFQFPIASPAIYVDGDRVITPAEKDRFAMDIFDSTGKKVTSISRDYEPLKITQKYKDRVHVFFKTMPDTKPFYESIKQMISFGDKFPPIQGFFVADKTIYIQTYLEKDDKYEFFVYDTGGKFIQRLLLPVHYMYGIRISPTAVKNNTFYQLVENEDEEVWELHGVKILAK
jgi:hypothetical protein